jgi:redox-sensitive bicupin YhaK (pirin superfamily)
MAQLWVNLPRAHKMDAPRYQGLRAGDMGIVELPGARVRVIAGEYAGVKGPAKTFTPIDVYDVTLVKAGTLELDLAAHHTVALLVASGSITANGSRAGEGDLVLFDHAGEHVAIEADTDAHVLVLSGEPIREPIVQYGPFVMTSEREIVQAIADFNGGAFGELAD